MEEQEVFLSLSFSTDTVGPNLLRIFEKGRQVHFCMEVAATKQVS
jgi:hypothetical protein